MRATPDVTLRAHTVRPGDEPTGRGGGAVAWRGRDRVH